MLKPKRLFLSFGIGAAFTLLLLGLSEKGIAPVLTGVLLSPGLLLAASAGSGAHDLQAYYLVGVGDTVLYGAISLFILILVKGKPRNHEDI